LLRHYSIQFQFANSFTNAVSLFFLTHSIVEAINHACVWQIFLCFPFRLNHERKKNCVLLTSPSFQNQDFEVEINMNVIN